MKLAPSQLEAHLKRGLAPVYLISGDEPLLVREACDLVRRHVQEQGYREREVMEVGRDFDWGRLYEAANAMGLFGDRRLLEKHYEGMTRFVEFCRSRSTPDLLPRVSR